MSLVVAIAGNDVRCLKPDRRQDAASQLSRLETAQQRAREEGPHE